MSGTEVDLSPLVDAAGERAFTTGDGLPYIGGHAAYPGVLFALGYGGNGITFSMIASQVLRDAVLGAENDSARLFRFDQPRLAE